MLAAAQQRTGVKLRLIEAFFRVSSPDQMAAELADLKLALAMPEASWLVGSDLLGNERLTPMLETSQALYAGLRQLPLQRTVHAVRLAIHATRAML